MFSQTELEKAVWTRDAEKVRALLTAKPNVTMRVNHDDGTVLHESNSVEVTEELLRHGAHVDETNKYRETPLHSAVSHGRGVAMVRALLKHGARVDSIDRKGNTPLNLAVKRQDREIIKELLEYEADINIRNRERRLFEDHNTPLDNAMSYPESAKLLIKYTLLKNFDTHYRKIINLQPYTKFRAYNEMVQFLEDCIQEVNRMKTDMITDNFSVYEFVITKDPCLKRFHLYKKIKTFVDQASTVDYPIYQDIISDKATLAFERENLMNELSKLAIYVRSNQNVSENIILNSDCTLHMARYLSNQDIRNFLTAFKDLSNKRANQELTPIEIFAQSCENKKIKLDESSIASSSASVLSFSHNSLNGSN